MIGMVCAVGHEVLAFRKTRFVRRSRRPVGIAFVGFHHEPLVSRALFDRVQEVFERANRPLYSKHGHPFAGLLTCGRCGCAITAELKKQQYLYYHCTGSKGPCGNTWIRDEDLRLLLADVIHRIHIPVEIADRLADALRESQADKERFSRTSPDAAPTAAAAGTGQVG
jgi:site-specific DNA recombinase